MDNFWDTFRDCIESCPRSTVESMMQLVKFQPALVTHTGAFFRFWWRHVQIPYDDPFFYDLHREWKTRAATPEVRLAFGFASQVWYTYRGLRLIVPWLIVQIG